MRLRFIGASVFVTVLLSLVFLQVNTLTASAHENEKACHKEVTYDNHHNKHEVTVCPPISFPKVTPTPTPPISYPKVTPVQHHDDDRSDHHEDNHSSNNHH